MNYTQQTNDSNTLYLQEELEFSEWKCQVFGVEDGITLHPKKGKEPNLFWRMMQYLILGNKWTKE